MAPRAVADGGGGTIIAVADIPATPERVFDALSTDQVERWWRALEYYFLRDWTADPRVAGPWSAEVVWADGRVVPAEGEFCEVSRPGKLGMTRRFGNHLFMGARETTITYRIEPSEEGTRPHGARRRLHRASRGGRRQRGTLGACLGLARRIHSVDLRDSATVVSELISSNEESGACIRTPAGLAAIR